MAKVYRFRFDSSYTLGDEESQGSLSLSGTVVAESLGEAKDKARWGAQRFALKDSSEIIVNEIPTSEVLDP